MNIAAFENLKRVLRTVSEGELRMDCWDSCAIGYASQDPWFRQQRVPVALKQVQGTGTERVVDPALHELGKVGAAA